MADKGDHEMLNWAIALFVIVLLSAGCYFEYKESEREKRLKETLKREEEEEEEEEEERRRNNNNNKNNKNNNNTQQRSPPRPPHLVELERRLKETLERIRIEEEEEERRRAMWKDEDVNCAICLEKETCSILYSVLPDCKHVFHAKCITQWLNIHESCPICRTPCLRASMERATKILVM